VAVEDRKLFPQPRLFFEYVYQADGSQSFVDGALETGILSWRLDDGGVDFSEGRVEGYDSGDLRDLELLQELDVLSFDIWYVTGNDGFYDAGLVPFELITEAAETGYSTTPRLARLDHVYVVRTFEEDHYAKFVVLANEWWFRNVPAGDPDPMTYPSYGLTVDLSSCSTSSRLYAKRRFETGRFLGDGTLPCHWKLSSTLQTGYAADITMTYDEAEVTARGVLEENLMVLRSSNQGNAWFVQETVVDPVNNTMTVKGLTSLGWFAIAASHPGDFDYDGDVDFADFEPLLFCLLGPATTFADTHYCREMDLNGDADVDLGDFAVFQAGFSESVPEMSRRCYRGW
jgi:hypothetical protein